MLDDRMEAWNIRPAANGPFRFQWDISTGEHFWNRSRKLFDNLPPHTATLHTATHCCTATLPYIVELQIKSI